ncbi:MAG: twin-arginine translocation signal domain-containing protein [Thermodesulfobacteriota bacterium]|nr:twin-arginine translocation signal domain-containing protein [Thermodesulfobacteriota bacterium]
MKKETDLDRRKFLKGSVIGAGVLTTGFATGLSLPGTAHASLPTLPLPYCRIYNGSSWVPSSDPGSYSPSYRQAVLDPDDVRVMTWWYYNSGKG